jgi:hypothetical protein
MYEAIPFASIAVSIASPLFSSTTLLSTPNVVFDASAAAAAAAVSGDDHDDDDDDKDHKKHKKCKKHHDKDDRHKKYKSITEISKIWTAKNSPNRFLSF